MHQICVFHFHVQFLVCLIFNNLILHLGVFTHADPNIKLVSCSSPLLNKKCLQVQFENGEIDIAELDRAFKNDSTNYVGNFKNAPDVRVFASIPYQDLGFDVIHVSLQFRGISSNAIHAPLLTTIE